MEKSWIYVKMFLRKVLCIMNNKKPGLIERFFTWLFEPVNDIIEDATDSIAEKVSKKIKEDKLLEEEDEGNE
ncbi:MAG: hypothetical protein KAS46_05015 [Candidatus Aureabacteria bacterium]|nr:hypothetical protein [Candidatus Auribacterota bacterium]